MDKKHLVEETFDPETGITERFYYDNGKVTIQRIQDIDDNYRLATAIRNSAPTNFNDSKNGIFAAASVPAVEIERWKSQYGFDWFHSDHKEKRKWMNGEHGSPWKLRNVKL